MTSNWSSFFKSRNGEYGGPFMILRRIVAGVAGAISATALVGVALTHADPSFVDPGRTQADYTYLTTLHLKVGVPIGDSEGSYDRVIAEGHGICKDLQSTGNPAGEAQFIYDHQIEKVTRDQATGWVHAASVAYCSGLA